MFPVKRLFPFQRTTPRNCFQILGVDVLLDSSLQPCLGRRNQSFTMKKRARLKVARLRLCSGNPALYLLLSSYITSFHHFYLHHFKSAFLVSTLGSTCPRFLPFSPKDATDPQYDCPNTGTTPAQ